MYIYMEPPQFCRCFWNLLNDMDIVNQQYSPDQLASTYRYDAISNLLHFHLYPGWKSFQAADHTFMAIQLTN